MSYEILHNKYNIVTFRAYEEDREEVAARTKAECDKNICILYERCTGDKKPKVHRTAGKNSRRESFIDIEVNPQCPFDPYALEDTVITGHLTSDSSGGILSPKRVQVGNKALVGRVRAL